jgi:hypothetical protein
LGLYADRIRLHQKDVNHDLMRDSSGVEEMDSLFAACIMLTSLFYHINEVDLPHTSWTVSPPNQAYQDGRCEPGIDWLTNTSGLSILMQLKQFHQRLGESVWLPFIVESTQVNGLRPRMSPKMNVSFPPPSDGTRFPSTASSSTSGNSTPPYSLPQRAHDFQAPPLRLPELAPATLPDIPPHLLALVLISPNLSIYSPALFPLQKVLSLDPANLSNFAAFISFPSLLSPELIALVRQRNPQSNRSSEDKVYRCTNGRGKQTTFTASIPGYTSIDIDTPTAVWPEMSPPPPPPDPDPIALLIFGYWFERIGAIPHWWCGRRGRGECVAILQWLKGRLAQAGGGCAASNGKEGRKLFVRAVHEFKQHVATASADWGDDIGRVLLEVVLEEMAEPGLSH